MSRECLLPSLQLVYPTAPALLPVTPVPALHSCELVTSFVTRAKFPIQQSQAPLPVPRCNLQQLSAWQALCHLVTLLLLQQPLQLKHLSSKVVRIECSKLRRFWLPAWEPSPWS
ncbi:hypothetical protein INT44_003466 [Umbelopsis vinacea]|uniref:Uncharacterized protein n=1 Tax=Umbelopsis vinacea TaxID=44442 RepID=A0A8H7PUA6_9FUNG|nr:hypothetical protein INT44_003466 [Umbelopsis vinacea]